MYAGPLAESAVTASMCFSSTTTVRPTTSNMWQVSGNVFRTGVLAFADRRHPRSQLAWRVGHGANYRNIRRQIFFDHGGWHRRRHRHDQLLRRDVPADLAHDFLDHLRLHRDHDDVGAFCRFDVARCRLSLSALRAAPSPAPHARPWRDVDFVDSDPFFSKRLQNDSAHFARAQECHFLSCQIICHNSPSTQITIAFTTEALVRASQAI